MGVRDWREVGELTVGSERYSHRCRRFLRKESGGSNHRRDGGAGFRISERGWFRMEDSDNALVLLDAIWIKGSA